MLYVMTMRTYECGGLSGGCRAGLTLKRWRHLTAALSVETQRRFGCVRVVSTRYASSELQFGAFRNVVARER